ncbi:MAG: response regulator [Actinomycetota bacterium]
MRVLVVSEDAKERLRAASALQLHAGAEVVEADSAEMMRQFVIVDGSHFDVLVVDGDLQPRGGFATLYDLRARAELSGSEPIASIVMMDRRQDAWLAGWAGANDVVLKPVDPFDLAHRVAALEHAEAVPYGDAGSDAGQLAAAIRDHR